MSVAFVQWPSVHLQWDLGVEVVVRNGVPRLPMKAPNVDLAALLDCKHQCKVAASREGRDVGADVAGEVGIKASKVRPVGVPTRMRRFRSRGRGKGAVLGPIVPWPLQEALSLDEAQGNSPRVPRLVVQVPEESSLGLRLLEPPLFPLLGREADRLSDRQCKISAQVYLALIRPIRRKQPARFVRLLDRHGAAHVFGRVLPRSLPPGGGGAPRGRGCAAC